MCPVCHEPLPTFITSPTGLCIRCDMRWRPPYEAHEAWARVVAIGPGINPMSAEVKWWRASIISPDEPRWRDLFAELTILPPVDEPWNPGGEEMSHEQKANIAEGLAWAFAPTPDQESHPVIRLRLYAPNRVGFLEGYPRLGGKPVWAVKERRGEPSITPEDERFWLGLRPRPKLKTGPKSGADEKTQIASAVRAAVAQLRAEGMPFDQETVARRVQIRSPHGWAARTLREKLSKHGLRYEDLL